MPTWEVVQDLGAGAGVQAALTPERLPVGARLGWAVQVGTAGRHGGWEFPLTLAGHHGDPPAGHAQTCLASACSPGFSPPLAGSLWDGQPGEAPDLCAPRSFVLIVPCEVTMLLHSHSNQTGMQNTSVSSVHITSHPNSCLRGPQYGLLHPPN